jgi:hypothetical protein
MRLSMFRTLYDQAARGLPVLGVPTEEAQRLHRNTHRDAAADYVVRRAVVLSSATGFACGLPGYLAMPVTVPSNVAGVLLVQFHMCASIAALADWDPQDLSVRKRSIECVLDSPQDLQGEPTNRANNPVNADAVEGINGQDEQDEQKADASPPDEITELLRRITGKFGERGLRFISERAIRWAYNSVRRADHGARSLPFLGGAIGAVTDGVDTQSVGERARQTFFEERPASNA